MEAETGEVELAAEKIEFLIRAIEDAQSSIQFADAKAGAIIGAWGLLLSVLSTYFSWSMLLSGRSQAETALSLILAAGALVCLVRSIWLAFLTIAPKAAASDNVQTDLPAEYRELFYLYSMTPVSRGQGLFGRFPVSRLAVSTADYYRKFRDLEIDVLLRTLIYELQCVSFIRNLKMTRLNAALNGLLQFLLFFFAFAVLRSAISLYSYLA